MYKLTIVNSSNKRYTMTQRNDIKMEYLDGFYSSTATVSTSKIGLKDGALVTAKTANNRNLGLYFYIQSNELENRMELYDVFRVKEKVTVYFQNDRRNVKIEAYVEDINIKPENNPVTCQVILVTEDAYFSEVDEIIETLRILKDSFVFPFDLEESGEPFGVLDYSSIRNINNAGAVETGVLISMQKIDNSGADIVNPTISKVNTGEVFFFTTLTITSNEIVYIDTIKKLVYKVDTLTNERTNLFNYIAYGSTWLTLSAGINPMATDAELGSENLEVLITYTKKYQGV